MIAPKIFPIRDGQILTTGLTNQIISRIEYVAQLLKEGKCLAGNGISVSQVLDGAIISSGGGIPVVKSETIEVFVDSQIEYYISATGNPTKYDAINRPAEVVVDTTTGRIGGQALFIGTFEVTIIATNEFGTGTGKLTIKVIESQISIFTTLGGIRAIPQIRIDWNTSLPVGTTFYLYRNGSLIATNPSRPYFDFDISHFIAYRYYVVASTGDISATVINGCVTTDYIPGVSSIQRNYFPFTYKTDVSFNLEYSPSSEDPVTISEKYFIGFGEGERIFTVQRGIFGPGGQNSATGTISGFGALTDSGGSGDPYGTTIRVYKRAEQFFATATLTRNSWPYAVYASTIMYWDGNY